VSIEKAIQIINPDAVEIIVSDNNSLDNTESVVRAFEFENLKYYKNKSNLGFAKNFLNLIKYSTGDYLLFISDEDTMCESSLEIMIDATKATPSFIFAGIKRPNGIPYYRYKKTRLVTFPNSAKYLLFGHSYLTGYCVKKDLLDFEKLYQIVQSSVHQIYPHEVISQLNLSNSTLYLISEYLFIQGEKDEKNCISTDEKYLYDHPDSRLKQLEEAIKIIQHAYTNKEIVLKAKNRLTRWAIFEAFHPFVKQNYSDIIPHYIKNIGVINGQMFKTKALYLVKNFLCSLRKIITLIMKQ
jgi:glycosyltransferase involved in cell wall biosynthesis